MATITFRYQPSYEQNETDVTLIEPTVEHTLEIPDSNSLSRGLHIDEIQYHFNMWLRGLGFIIED